MRCTRGWAALPLRAAQFSGTGLNRPWTRKFILGSLLQKYSLTPTTATPVAPTTSSSSSSPTNTTQDGVLQVQRVLSSAWKMPVAPLDSVSEARILRLLARYASGEGSLAEEALEDINTAVKLLHHHTNTAKVGHGTDHDDDDGMMHHVGHPHAMRLLLEKMRVVVPGDNLLRTAYAGELHYPAQAYALIPDCLGSGPDGQRRDGEDAFDDLRHVRDGPAYAIDSATTSEVDDAIGVEQHPRTGATRFVVYVSDATAYCPMDSPLEHLTARTLTTTTYLPEGVFFMLPKAVVEAATLREDRVCRTFNIFFGIDDATGAITDYGVEVGWLRQLRRLTYEQVQHTLVAEDVDGTHTVVEQPSWWGEGDARAIRCIHAAAKRRFDARLERQRQASHNTQGGRGSGGTSSTTTANNTSSSSSTSSTVDTNVVGVGAVSGGDMSLPDPYITVRGTRVVSVCDQILGTVDARMAVAELMIAANEVCSRVAQEAGISIPFRGTRALSSDHEVAAYFEEPQGVAILGPRRTSSPTTTTTSGMPSSGLYVAEAMHQSVRRLSSVTRAIYHHTPLHHAGLATSNYAHSTSPLRRFPDMLVHHQLKVLMHQQHAATAGSHAKKKKTMKHNKKKKKGGRERSSTTVMYPVGELLPEHSMASLCSMISTKQEQASKLQDGSIRYWLLKYMQDRWRGEDEMGPVEQKRRYLCLVGETRCVGAAPAYARFLQRPAEALEMLDLSSSSSSWEPATRYVSEVYLPEVQLAHTIRHNLDGVLVGSVVECEVMAIFATQGLLELRLVRVLPGGDERQLERLWTSGWVAHCDS